jgi:Acylphosphatases
MEKLEHLNIRVSGRVQGVRYRASAQEEARRLGLAGFVRNEKDGSVYLEVEGSPEVLEEFVRWSHVGPPAAVVTTCVVESASVKNFVEFSIHR